jgi:hypothetical protein
VADSDGRRATLDDTAAAPAVGVQVRARTADSSTTPDGSTTSHAGCCSERTERATGDRPEASRAG